MKSSSNLVRYSQVSEKYGDVIISKLSERYEDVFSTYFRNKKSKNTKIAYLNDIKLFFTYLFYKKKDVNPKGVTYRDIVEYREFLESESFNYCGRMIKYSKATINRKLSSVSSFFIELIRHGEVSSNPCTHVERLNVSDVPKTEAISPDFIRELFDSVPRNKLSDKLHFAILSLFFFSGLRISEITNLKVSSYKRISSTKGELFFVNKGGEDKVKRIPESVCDSIEDYLSMCRSLNIDTDKDSYLFRPTNKGTSASIHKKLQNSSVRRMLKRKFERFTNSSDSHYPHQARATYITELFKMNYNASDIAQDVFHKSIKTTNSYRSKTSYKKDLSSSINY